MSLFIGMRSSIRQLVRKALLEEREHIAGGLAKGRSLQDIADKHGVELSHIESELKKGIKVEMEHTNDPSIAREIAKDHLMEDPDYYDKLEKMEKGECDN